jgi:lipoyl(octanoyl) transferase
MFIIRELGTVDYQETWNNMLEFTLQRTPETIDEIWLLEHPPVYTLGQAGKHEHIFHRGQIPVVQTDRGGQVTYHGPGQLIAYFLLDCKKNDIGIRQLVDGIENLTIDILKVFNIDAEKQCGAPGVYVQQKKIASLGLRIKNNCSYHGLAINIDMDLSPFRDINPCGYKQLEMTQTCAIMPEANMHNIKQQFTKSLMNFVYQDKLFKPKEPVSQCRS